MEQRRSIGLLHALLAVTIWSGNFIIASGFVNALPPVALACMRWLVATMVFFPFALKYIRRDIESILAHRWSLLVASITGVSLFNTIVYISARTTDTANMALFASTTPVFVVVLSRVFLGERINFARAAGLTVAITGMLIIATRGHLDVLLSMTFRAGDIWMFFAGLLWAVYSILVKKKPQEISSQSYLGVTFLVGLIPLIPAAFIESVYSTQWDFTWAVGGAVLYVGIGASLAAFFLWNSAVQIIGPGTASLFQYFMPVFSGIGAFFILDQPVTVAHGIGFLCIFVGVFTATRP